MDSSIHSFLQALSIPWIGLSSVGIFSFLSATLIPLSSEAVFFGYLMKFPENIWALIGVATVGNTLGGVFNWGLGFLSKKTKNAIQKKEMTASKSQWVMYFEKWGTKSLLLSWIPFVGDPLTVVAGWSQWKFWPCLMYMMIGKCLRYIAIAYFFTISSL
jgi:hypothetical protein